MIVLVSLLVLSDYTACGLFVRVVGDVWALMWWVFRVCAFLVGLLQYSFSGFLIWILDD